LGDLVADLYVESCLIVELKACKTIIGDHIAQLPGYLRASRIEHGLLINFGASKLEVKKYILSHSS
jgi:GxxExxY protein